MSILLSVQPEWCCKILNKEKILEIRKSIPKCELPCKVYIYCTKSRNDVCIVNQKDTFIYKTTNIDCVHLFGHGYIGNGKVVAEFTLNEIDKIEICDPYIFRNNEQEDWKYFEKNACLTCEQMMEYIGYGEDHDGWDKKYDTGYAWHIDNLIIYNKPKELSEFKVYDKTYDNVGAFGWAFDEKEKYHSLTRAPQSWCYVEAIKN